MAYFHGRGSSVSPGEASRYDNFQRLWRTGISNKITFPDILGAKIHSQCGEAIGNGSTGQAILTFLLLLGSLVVFLGLAVGLSGFVESSLGAGLASSQEAYAIALAGLEDAILRVILNKSFTSAGYTITIGNGATTVVVEQGVPQAAQVRITSTGVVRARNRKVEAILNVDAITGKVNVVSKKEVAL